MRASALKLVLVIPILSLIACDPGREHEKLDFQIPVKVATIETGNVEDLLKLTGSLRVESTVSLAAESRGILRIASRSDGLPLAEGDRVKAGQLVAELVGEDVRVAARTEATRQRYLEAQSDLEAKEKLLSGGLITPTELRAAKTALADAKLEYDRSRLSEKRSRLVSPVDGVILELARDSRGKRVAAGQLLQAGEVVARIAPKGPLVADVDVLGPDIGRIAVGQKARVSSVAFPGQEFSGKVLRLAPTVDETTRTLRAEVEVENDRGLLKPGLFVRVDVLIQRHENVPVIPRSAVVERTGKRVVFVAKGQTVEQREVQTGLGDDATVEIVSGLKPGESIVIQGMETLADHSKIRVTL